MKTILIINLFDDWDFCHSGNGKCYCGRFLRSDPTVEFFTCEVPEPFQFVEE
jgi:hypothetical protein